MPNTYSISNLLEIKDLIVDDFLSSSTDIHLYFYLEQRYVYCPFCNSITNKVRDYRTSVNKSAPIQGKFLFLHYKNGSLSNMGLPSHWQRALKSRKHKFTAENLSHNNIYTIRTIYKHEEQTIKTAHSFLWSYKNLC